MAAIVAGSRSLFLIFSFLAGVLFLQVCAELPSLWWAAGLVPTAWLCWRCPRWRPGLVVLLCVLGGFSWTAYRADRVLSRTLPAAWEGRDMLVSGVVDTLPQRHERYLKFNLDVETGSGPIGSSSTWRGRILLRWYEPAAEVRGGERWRLLVRLKRPHGFQNPGGFDYERHLFRAGVNATGYVRPDSRNRRLGGTTSLTAAREQVRQMLSPVLTELPAPAAALLAALVLGDRAAIEDWQWQVLQQTGTTHLMAISGLHIGLIAGLACWLTAWLWRFSGPLLLWLPAARAGALGAMLAAAGYAALAGFAVPTQRALVMLSCFMLALWWRRSVWSWSTLTMALWLLLWVDPLIVLAPGFWLSFLGVVVIGLAIQTSVNAPRWRLWLRCQWMLGIVLAPAVAGFFGQTALLAPFANLMAIPAVGFGVVPLALLGTALLAIGLESAGGAILNGAAWILEWLLPLLKWLAGLPGAVWRPAPPAVWVVVAATLGGIGLVLPWDVRWRLLALIWWLPLLYHGPDAPPARSVRITVLDVGQGLAVVVQTRRHTLLYDAGPRFSSRFNAGDAVVVPFLRGQGISRLDRLVVSHGDNDHIGGVAAVRRAIPVEGILSSVSARIPGSRPCVRGTVWYWDGVRFELMHPVRASPPPHNNASCVVKVSSGYGSMLITGDIEAEVEASLVREVGDLLAAEVLLVPHQGSNTSSSGAFIDTVAPMLAVVATGYRNAYGHPATRVVNRYRRRGIPLLNTAASGAVTVIMDGEGIRWHSYREYRRRYWFPRP